MTKGKIPLRHTQKRFVFQFFILFCLIAGSFFIWHMHSPNAWGITCQERVARSDLPESDWYIQYTPEKSPILLDAGAKVVSPSELLREGGRYNDYNMTKSRIIHQSWKTKDVEGYPLHELWHSQDHWIAHHPGWIYVLWDNNDNRELVRTRFPELLDVYDGFRHDIERADFVRPLYMYAFGGIYSDLDVLPLRNLIHHLNAFASDREDPVAYVGEMLQKRTDAIPNAWMASSRPAHPFWKSLYERIVAATKRNSNPNIRVEDLTGPGPLYHSVKQWKSSKPEVVVLKSPTIFPYSWDESNMAIHCICSAKYADTFDPRRCISLYRDSWTITFWGSSWFKVDSANGKTVVLN